MRAKLAARLRDPVAWADAAQLVKTVLAAAIAWLIAVHVFHLEQAFLAPWAALLTVHATVFGTVRRGVQQVATSIVGVLIAFAVCGGMLVSRLLDTGIGIAVGLLVNLAVWPPLRDRAAAHRIDKIDDRIGDLLHQIAGRSEERRVGKECRSR